MVSKGPKELTQMVLTQHANLTYVRLQGVHWLTLQKYSLNIHTNVGRRWREIMDEVPELQELIISMGWGRGERQAHKLQRPEKADILPK